MQFHAHTYATGFPFHNESFHNVNLWVLAIQWFLRFKTTRSARKNDGLKLALVLYWKDIYTENIMVMSLISCHKMEGIVKYWGLKAYGPLYVQQCLALAILAAYGGKVNTVEV